MLKVLSSLAVAALCLCALPCAQVRADPGQSAGEEWPMVAGDLRNTRYSSLTLINTRNVRRLGAAWVSPRFDEGTTTWVTPVVQHGLLFTTAGSEVYALDARTGKRVWTYKTASGSQPENPLKIIDRPVPNWKGVGVGQGLVFVGLMEDRKSVV